jgi:hypothetical protein
VGLLIGPAKAVPIESEIVRRGIKLVGRGHERCGSCPVCGGRDRFSINVTKGLFNCRGCNGRGDVIDLVQFLDGVDHRTACRTLAGIDIKGLARAEMASPRKSETPIIEGRENKPIERANTDTGNNAERALQLWHDASPIGTSAEAYFHGRGLRDLPGDDVIRFLKRCPYDGARQDCVISLYRNIVTDAPQAICRTAIDSSGTKIGRLTLGPTRGGAIKIDADTDVEYGLTVAEGLETALAARMKGLRPCWATGSAGGIRAFPVLPGIDSLTILVDNDHPDQRGRRAGGEAATECWRRWRDAGREVRAFTTNQPGTDIADIFEGGRP